MAAINDKQIIAGTATSIKSKISWTDVEDINTWEVEYKYYDAQGTLIKTVSQPVPANVLGQAGMTLTIARNIQIWIVQQAGVTIKQ